MSAVGETPANDRCEEQGTLRWFHIDAIAEGDSEFAAWITNDHIRESGTVWRRY